MITGFQNVRDLKDLRERVACMSRDNKMLNTSGRFKSTIDRIAPGRRAMAWWVGSCCAMGGLAYGQAPLSLRPSGQDELPQTSRLNAGLGNPSNRGPTSTTAATRSPATRSTGTGASRGTFTRVGRAPNMFGDTLPPLVTFGIKRNQGATDLPRDAYSAPLGGGGSYNVSENNTAIPTDRVYFVYNAFYNAISTSQVFGSPQTRSIDLHRYVAGFEKTFLDGNVSLDVRMPLLSGFELSNPVLTSDMGNLGNLTMFAKGLVYADEDVAVATGLGIGLPTGSDLNTRTLAPFVSESLVVRNQAVRLMPFVAATMNLNDQWFLQSFGQMNFAASGNEVANQNGVIGVFNEQHLLQTDLGLGRWIWRDATRPVLTGLAGVLELHYTTTVQETDTVQLSGGNLLNGSLSNSANRQDLLNLTSGLQAQLGAATSLRVGAVVPLRDQPDRVFDSEVQVSLNRKF